MNEIFKGFNLEIVMNNVSYEVESAAIDAIKNFIMVSVQVENVAHQAELIISGSQHLFASAKVNIRESWAENDRTMLACEAPPKDFHFFKRNFLRLETDIPVEYLYMKAEQQELTPISVMHKGTLNDFSPCGAMLAIDKKEVVFNPKDPSLYLKLNFSLPNATGIDTPQEIIGKMVNLKKSWDNYHLGILFLINSFKQYRFLENFYKEMLTNNKTYQNESNDDDIQHDLKKALAIY
jgi:hypothetical protein